MVLLGVCGCAFLLGGRPERIGASINLLASFATTGLRLADPHFNMPADAAVLGIDVSVAVGFFWLAIATIRFWPIWAFGFAVANLGTSAAGGWLPQVSVFAYLTGLGIYAYLALGALLVGTLCLPRNAGPWVRRGMRRHPASAKGRPVSECPADLNEVERPEAQRDN
ncbi:hypothetical protein [uncultured Sphingomonas sp.]|uniref:hypothetical protein n=1 Tax=uncultured Sphingomonas sp. TaxID=158754 RepID=UPI002617BFE2|nr:hypothetical protein [uncultured Sphingomonas sp.]